MVHILEGVYPEGIFHARQSHLIMPKDSTYTDGWLRTLRVPLSGHFLTAGILFLTSSCSFAPLQALLYIIVTAAEASEMARMCAIFAGWAE